MATPRRTRHHLILDVRNDTSLVTACDASPPLVPVSDLDHLKLARLVNEFSWRVDHLEAATLTELVTDDVQLRLDLSAPVIGRDAFKSWGTAFDQTTRSRVFATSSQVTASLEAATVRSALRSSSPTTRRKARRR